MFEMSCPWCEVELPVTVDAQEPLQTCSECLTTWSWDGPAEPVLAVAA